MKKKFVSLFVAVAMMLALPSVAFAVDSPASDTITVSTESSSGDTEVTLSVDTSGVTAGEIERVVATEEVASNVPTDDENVTVLASFEITGSDDLVIDPETGLVLTFDVGTDWAGYTATVYIQHSSGDTDSQTVTVTAGGTVSIRVYELSVFTITVDESTAPSTTADGSGTSPATGVSMLPVLCVTAAAVVGAGVCAVSLRKRLSK